MSRSTDLALLRRIADGAETPTDRAVLAERVRAYLAAAPRGASLDAAFGLAPAAGRLHWWQAQAIEARDAALRMLASRHFAGLPQRTQAREIRRALSAYASGQWRIDRTASAVPGEHIGTAREVMFDLMRAREAVPSVEHIRRVLRGAEGGS
ncbi:hypothetical protein MKK50_16235 [Methylobacterium sp. J-043]|nr:hypothetical protein [Methylobacterium sp. J-043]